MPRSINVPRTFAALISRAGKADLQAIQDLLQALANFQITLVINGRPQPPVSIVLAGTGAQMTVEFRQRYPDGVPAAISSSARLTSVNGNAQNSVNGTVGGESISATGAYGFTNSGDFYELINRVNQIVSTLNSVVDAVNQIRDGEARIQSGDSG